MSDLKGKYEEIIEKLREAGKVEEMGEEKRDKIVEKVEKDLEEYRFENQKRIRESQEEIASIVLTA